MSPDPIPFADARALHAPMPFDVDRVRERLEAGGGGYEQGKPVPLTRGEAAFVPAGARHAFTGYEGLSVLVIFARQWRAE